MCIFKNIYNIKRNLFYKITIVFFHRLLAVDMEKCLLALNYLLILIYPTTKTRTNIHQMKKYFNNNVNIIISSRVYDQIMDHLLNIYLDKHTFNLNFIQIKTDKLIFVRIQLFFVNLLCDRLPTSLTSITLICIFLITI